MTKRVVVVSSLKEDKAPSRKREKCHRLKALLLLVAERRLGLFLQRLGGCYRANLIRLKKETLSVSGVVADHAVPAGR